MGGQIKPERVAGLVGIRTGCHACWITLTELVEPEDFVSILGDYCASNKLEIAAERLRTAERVTWAKIVAEIIQRFPVAVVIDRLDAASTRTSALIETIASAVASFASGGSLALTGREQPLWWNDVARNAPRATSVSLAGLSPPAAISMLADSGIGADDNERAGLVRAVGAHAQSLVLLRQARTAENAEIQNMGVEAAKDWLLRRVLDGLPERERESLARLSIFSYAAPLDLAYAVLDPLGRDNVRALQRKEFVRIELDTVVIHDAVRSAASDFIGDSTVRACHQAAADHLFESIVDEFEKTEFVAFEKSIPWAMHLQAWHGGEPAPDRFSLILAASDEHLLGLFAISKLGFPFAFGDADWTHALRVLEDLEEDGLIDENHKKPKKKKNLDEPIFSLVGFSFYDKLLITSLCYYRGLADNLGYIDDMRPNYTFAQQGLACPWEHCIELSPLPMISRSDWEAGLEEDRHRLANPELYQLTDQHKQVLTARVSGGVPDWVTETVDEELAARSCPIFGHGCPGGRTQAETCRKKGRFVWATRPSKSK